MRLLVQAAARDAQGRVGERLRHRLRRGASDRGAIGGAITGVTGSGGVEFPTGEDVIFAITTTRYMVFRRSFGLTMPRLSLAVVYESSDIVQLAVRRGTAMRKLLVVLGTSH